MVLGCLYLSTTHTLMGFYVAFTMIRVADQGLIKIGASVTAGKWFQRYRGRAVGLVFFGGSAGIIVMAPVVQAVISYWDWRVAWVVLAGVMCCVGVIPSALIIRRQPEDLGLAVDGITGREQSLEAGGGPDFEGAEQQFPLSRVLRTPTFWMILAALFLSSTTTAGIGLHLVPHLTHQGLTPAAAVGAVSVMSISGAVSALVSGVVAEKASAKLMMVSLNLLGAVSMWVLTLADTLPEAYLFAVVQGLVGSGVNTLAPIMWANYYGRRTLGSIFGISRSAQVVGFAVGPLASAAVFDRTGTYRAAFLALIIVALAASLLMATAKRPSGSFTTPEQGPQ